MIIKVCIGSACHLKGSYTVINRLMELVDENGLDDQVEIKAVFCLGHCVDAVSVEIDELQFFSVDVEHVDEFFYNNVVLAKH